MSAERHIADMIEHARASVARVGLVTPRFTIERAGGRVVTSTLPVPAPPAEGGARDAWYLQRCDTRAELMAALALRDLKPGDVFVTAGMSWLRSGRGAEEVGCVISAGFLMPNGKVRELETIAMVLETDADGRAHLREPQPLTHGADRVVN